MLISIDTARQLLDFRSGTSSITEEVARGQLEGAVALHNIPGARYSIALPDEGQFRRLWDRLPSLTKQRTGISALFVDGAGRVGEVR